ncbi:B3 domain-containing transcription factor VRN1-like isoform X1 [Punica granatum]|uniref:B3 domain-containing transcription factor VRN1-like isoform X1 n=1 Tax=Punica granatum TaxID=22663 RepID=A0A218XBV9_PUNGR|nr:B3 domain-containing transcription factor VRN1-like isoform X1 [Punica granatum]OWM82196.1 hypothetical protein CDL15_Pgr001770 [Punica granatum]
MASPRTGRNEQLHRTRYKPEHPHFLRVILPELLQLGKLPIPKAFVKSYGDNLLNWVLLAVPSGQTWTIQLEKHNGTVWMGQGWMNFVEYFSVIPKYSISFRWEGSFLFRTVIFDQTGCEIKYPLWCSHCKRLKVNDVFPSQKREGTHENAKMAAEADDDYRTHLSALGVNIRSEREEAREVDSDVKMPAEEHDDDFRAHLSALGINIRSGRATAAGGVTYHTHDEAKLASSQFHSNYPFFRLILRPSYMRNGQAWLPLSLISRYAGYRIHVMQLKHSGRSWRVNMHTYSDRKRAVFCRGWVKFLEDNSLHEGDICVFERTAPNKFNVITFICAH